MAGVALAAAVASVKAPIHKQSRGVRIKGPLEPPAAGPVPALKRTACHTTQPEVTKARGGSTYSTLPLLELPSLVTSGLLELPSLVSSGLLELPSLVSSGLLELPSLVTSGLLELPSLVTSGLLELPSLVTSGLLELPSLVTSGLLELPSLVTSGLLELPSLVSSGLSFTSVQTAGAHWLADAVFC